MKKRETLLDKLIKKDYSNNLEEILSKKIYPEEVKNLLQDILYKIDISYKDYETVKKNVQSKDEYIKNIISVIEKNCESINFWKKADVKTRTYAVNKERKQIICFPIEHKLLYCLAKIQKEQDIIKDEPEILNIAITNAINTGNNINMVEPLRDFNGYSWNISVHEIENFYYNLIYQNLIILIGNKILDEWANKYNELVDYMDLFEEDLEKKYGQKLAKGIVESIKNLSILLQIDSDKEYEKLIIKRMKVIHKELLLMGNRAKYLEDLSKQKKSIAKEIGEIDILLNDKDRLAYEYSKRNKKLPLEEKIFSKRVFTNILKEEKENKLQKLRDLNERMNSTNFLETQRKLQYEQEYANLADIQIVKPRIIAHIMLFQKQVLEAIKIKTRKTSSKEKVHRILYELRYLNLIPVSESKNIGQIVRLRKNLDDAENELFLKMEKLKMINTICKDEEKNKEVLRNVFSLNIIQLADLYAKITKDKDDKYYIQFYDDNIEDKKMEININKKDLKIRLNKKIKVFI